MNSQTEISYKPLGSKEKGKKVRFHIPGSRKQKYVLMSTVGIRARVEGAAGSKIFQFPYNTLAKDVSHHINKNLGKNEPSLQDYGLLLVDEDPMKERWLDLEKTLHALKIEDGMTIVLRKKERLIKLKLLDGSYKIIPIDETETVGELVVSIAKKLGVNNHEEYSLVLDDEGHKKRLLKRAKEDKKIEKMRRKMRTDDDTYWLDHELTLHEQGLGGLEEITLRKKYFYSDQSINKSDTVQVNLLYVQSRDAILNGTHPCTLDEACRFAGMQLHIDYGDHNADKHKPGFLDDLASILPAEYVKTKNIEKKIFAEHKSHVGKAENDVKYEYVNICRALKTYGVTFFFVKEKEKGKNKLVPRLLGITKESVMRLDDKTKEVIKTWPLTTVRRWASTPTTFTLDFGDYQDSYYSVQSTEGEAISQLIAGYIDIILKEKKKKADDEENNDAGGEEGDSATPRHLQSSRPSQGDLAGYHKGRPSVQNSSSDLLGENDREGSLKGRKSTIKRAHGLQSLSTSIDSTLAVLKTADLELKTPASLPPLGTDPASLQWRQNTLDVSRENVVSQIAALSVATTDLLTSTTVALNPMEQIDYTSVGSSMTIIKSNTNELLKSTRLVAALLGGPGGASLLDACKGLCGSLNNLVKGLGPNLQNVNNRQELLANAQDVGANAEKVLRAMGDVDMNVAFQEALHNAAKTIAMSTSNLINSAKLAAGKCTDPNMQNNIIDAAKALALATSQLVTSTKVLGPTIIYPVSKNGLLDSTKLVAAGVENVVTACQKGVKDPDLLSKVGELAADITNALSSFIDQTKSSLRGKGSGPSIDSVVDALTKAAERLINSVGNTEETVKQAKAITQASSLLIADLKNKATQEEDKRLQTDLLSAARALADATSKLVDGAKRSAKDPGDASIHQELKAGAQHILDLAKKTFEDDIRHDILVNLIEACKQASSVSTQFISAAHAVASSNQNPTSQTQLNSSCEQMANLITSLISSIKQFVKDPGNVAGQLDVINAGKVMLGPSQRMIAAGKTALPTVSDSASAILLSKCIKSTTNAVSDLKKALQKATEAFGQVEKDSIFDILKKLGGDLANALKLANEGKLLPLPGDQITECVLDVGATTKLITSAVAQLLTAANQGDDQYTSKAAQDLVNALRNLTNGIRGVSATMTDKQGKGTLITAAKNLVTVAEQLITEANRVATTKATDNKLGQHAGGILNALNQIIDALPGQKEVLQLMKSLEAMSNVLKLPASKQATSTELQLIQQSLHDAASLLSDAAKNFVALIAKGSLEDLVHGANEVKESVENMNKVGTEVMALTQDVKGREVLLTGLKNVNITSSKLLLAGRSVALDPSEQSTKSQLQSAVKGLTNALNNLVTTCVNMAPGQVECDNAIRNIRAGLSLLEDPSAPLNDSNYFVCLDSIMDNSKNLGTALVNIATHARQSKHSEFCQAIKGTQEAILNITEKVAQVAYLVAISHPSTEPGVLGLVNQGQFTLAYQSIEQATTSLISSSTNKTGILEAATVIAKYTAYLCNECKTISNTTRNQVAKKEFIAYAKDIAQGTSNLVTMIKALSANISKENRDKCAQNVKPLLASVKALITYGANPEFLSVPAIISQDARNQQVPITSAGKQMIESSCNLILSAKSLIANPKDPPTWQSLANHSKSVSDAIKALVGCVREKTPAQTEIEDAIFILNTVVNDIGQAELSLSIGSLPQRSSEEGLEDSIVLTLDELNEALPSLVAAAKNEAERLARVVFAISNLFRPFADICVGISSKVPDKTLQYNILEKSRTVAESVTQLLFAVREAGGNPANEGQHPLLDEQLRNTLAVMKELSETLVKDAAQDGVVSSNVQMVAMAMDKLARSELPDSRLFTEYQELLTHLAKEVATACQTLMLKSTSDPTQIGPLCQVLATKYTTLCAETSKSMHTMNESVGTQLETAVRELGSSCMSMIEAGSFVQRSPSDLLSRKELALSSRVVMEHVSYVLAVLRSASRGTQACISALSVIERLLVDLETTTMFASTGSLTTESPDSFGPHRDDIVQHATDMVEDTKDLVGATSSSQDQLADAAGNILATYVAFNEAMRLGATAIGPKDIDAQLLLLNASKDVGKALYDLFDSTLLAAGRGMNDPAMDALKSNARNLVASISSMLKTVKSIDDETLRGLQALQTTIEALEHFISTLTSPIDEASIVSVAPEEMLHATRPVTTAVAKMVGALTSGKPSDLTTASNLIRSSVLELLRLGRVSAFSTHEPEKRNACFHATEKCGVSVRELLTFTLAQGGKPANNDVKKLALDLSRVIAASLNELCEVSRLLKGDDWVNPDDPNVLAEQELLSAANSIEAAAKKLESLQMAPSPRLANEELPFNEQIIEAARAIAFATALLMKSASSAQREITIEDARHANPAIKQEKYQENAQWSFGLVSAAKLVAIATDTLCETANATIQGGATGEKLIAAAKAVANSTAQLLVASQVKNSNNPHIKRLQTAGMAVKKAADTLVTAAHNSVADDVSVDVNTKLVAGLKQEFEAQAEVVRQEQQLEKAKQALIKLRVNKYGRTH